MGDMQDLFNEDGQSNEVPQITSGGSGQPMSIVNVHHDSSAAPTIVKLNGTNYSVWSQLLELHVAGKRKYGYLTGASAAPALADSNYNKWYAENAIGKGWLIQSMEPDILQIFLPYKTAKDEIEIERVYVFLAGLDDVFDKVRSDILRRDPFSNLEKAFSCVRREDQRRSTMMVPPTPVNTGVAMVARNSRPASSYKPADSTINGPTRHSMPASSYKPANSTANGPTGSTRLNGPQRVKPQNGERCTHCNSTNHFVIDCFKLHGYPEWWDEVKERNKAKVAAERYALGKVALCIGSPDPSVPQASPMPSVSSSIVPPGFAPLPTEREEVICNEKENAVTSVEDLASHVANPTLFPATPHIPHNCSPSSTPTVPVQIPEASDNPED
ncbi:hypothetical protein L3X38_022965 [Prunus dulcis]|uniref:Retrotransposon Copia-like N-terminal domain-containing protein n=1 Tax=Prunus dulcis TaxID=3755 RepID=A0AAD4VZJ5_PRUDU|nr:hypothetical protein L3X38_022965 [Prunus dulcis]